jgi:hypothetical protein
MLWFLSDVYAIFSCIMAADVDPLRHPDLVEADAAMRATFDRILAAEQAAAVIAYERSRTLRDRLLDADDCSATIELTTVSGTVISGSVAAVSADHIHLSSKGRDYYVALRHVTSIGMLE